MLELEGPLDSSPHSFLMKSQQKPKRGRVAHLIPDHLALLQNLGASDTRCAGVRGGVSGPEHSVTWGNSL